MKTIDCTPIQSPQDLHRILRDAFGFPEWYGNNLDALHDCLGSLSGTYLLENWAAAEAVLGRYGQAARRAMADAALKNQDLDLTFS